MDNFSTIFPRRQGQDLEIRPSWAPVTPARRFGNAPASGGAGLVRGDDGGGIRSGSVADGTGVEPGLMSFGGNSQQDLSFRELMQDLSGREVAGPVRPKISHFMQGWRQSFPNVVAVPSSPAVGSRQVAGPPDQLLLNGSFLLVSGHAQPVPKSSAGGFFFPSIPNLNFSPERRAVTGLEMSRMVPCPATPATLDKGRRVPDRLPREIVDLTGETMITLNSEEAVVVHQSQIENHIDTCFTRQTVTEPAEGKCTVGSSEEPSGQQLEAEKQDTAENAGIDLNKTPPQKPKRKKHRPKVIREDRPARKPKSATPRTVIQRAAKNNVTPTGKRKYVRKKKVENALDTPTEAVGENVDPRGGGSGVKKSVRRCLNFESEHLAGDGCPGSSTSRLACNAESSELQSRGTSTGNRSDGCTDKSTAQVSGGQNVGMNFIDGVPFDLNHWKNPIQAGIVNLDSSTSCALYQGRGQASVQYMQGEHSGMSEIQNPPYHQPSRREMIRENLNNLAKHTECVNVTNNMQNSLMNLLYGRAKRDHNHIGAAPVSTHTNFINAYEINQIRNFHETSANAPDSTDNNKKRRVEEQNELMSKTSSVRSCLVPCTPSRSWNLNQVSQPSPNAFTFSEALHLMAPEKLRDSARMLAFGHTDGDTSNGSNILGQTQNSASMTSTIDCSQLFTPEKPFGDGNLNHKLYSSPETLSSNYNCRQEDEICRPPILTEDTVTKSHPKPKRGRKPKKDRALADNSTSTNASGMRVHGPKTQNHSSSRRKSVRATPLGAEECQEKQSHSSQISAVQDCYSSSDLQESVYSSITSQAIVSYRDPIDDIIQKLQHLSINNVHEDVIAEAQNALVQYNGGNMLVPYEDVTRKRRSRPKVDLDPETSRVWRLLMLKDTIDGDAELDKDKAKWWKEERRVFRGRVDSFIARMHLVQGDRTFSPWKGSVVDSVVGVFLTQNVSDHLSSSAFMSLAAKFPLKSIQPDTEKASASFKQEGCIFSIRETVKLQTEPQGQEYLDRSSIVTHEVEDSKAKQTANTQKSPGTRSQSGDGPVSNSKCEGTYFQGNVVQISNRSPGTRTDSPLTVLASISLLEGEDIRSPEDAASSQRSVISSQNSSDYPFQTVDQLGAFLDSSIESDDLAVGNMCYGLDNYTSFTELLKMAENTKFQKLYSHGSGLLSSTQYCGAIDQLASTGDENRKSVLDLRDNQNGACSSVVVPNDSNDAQCDFSVTSNPSTSYDFHGVSNAILVEKETYGLSSLALVNAMTNSRMDRQFMPLPRTHLVTTGQQGSVTAETFSLFDPCASDGKNNLQSLNGLVGENCFNKQHCCNNQLPSEKPRAMLGKSIPQSATQSQGGPAAKDQPKGGEANIEREKSQLASEAQPKIANSKVNEFPPNLENKAKQSNPFMEAAQSNSKPDVASSNDTPEGMAINGPKQRRGKSEVEKNKSFDWDSLRKQAYCNGPPKERRSDRLDSLDWEAVRCADVSKISDTIRERGMNNMLAERIKEFLNRLVREHGSIDLEWLRDVPPDKAKEYLLSIRGLGLKSVECVRLLTLHHLAFPVDTNVGRISVRLGWVPLQPLPESLQLHLLELYPVLETIQKYLWPRLCTLDQRTLYELHYQLITFGKVFCTKSKPNCNACPMRGECKHFASAFASARLALPGPEEKGIVSSLIPVGPENNQTPSCTPIPMLQLEGNMLSQGGKAVNSCEPIIEEPATPEPECIETSESAIEDTFDEDPDEIPTIKLNLEQFTQNLQNYMQENNFEIQEGDMSKALVLLAPEAASIPMPKLKNVSRLRTEHQVYELPDSHPLLEGLDRRDPDDPCSYLLAIWTPGETAESTEPPEICCNSQDTGKLCDRITCFTCNSVREAQTQMIRGTLLIPCRTAMRGSFPLNGTYFQVNEVFADHESSHNPINVPRKWIWNLPRRTVYFGTSIPTIFRGLSTEGIQHCFWRGYVCVRGFDRTTRAPRPLFRRLHSPASKIIRSKKAAAATNKDE